MQADGPTFILLRDDSSPFISFAIWVRSGSACDPAGKEGLAYLTASMLEQGDTQTNAYDAILQKLFPMAAGYSISIDREMTVLQGKVHKDHLAAYYELLRDAILAPAFREADFERLRGNQVNEIETSLRYQDDEALAKAVLQWMVFEGTSYAHPEVGLASAVKALTLDDVRNFYRDQYTRDRIVIGLAGPFDGGFVERMYADFSRLPDSGDQAKAARSLPPGSACAPGAAWRNASDAAARPHGLRVTLIEKETRSTAISFGRPIDVTRASDEFYPLMIANSWLGEHRSSASHLYQVMRSARGLNYGDYSYIEWFAQGAWRQVPPSFHARSRQMFEVWIRPVMNANRHFALRQALREIDQLVENGLTAEQFALTRNFLLNFRHHYAPSLAARLGYAIDDQFYGLRQSHLGRIGERVQGADLAAVNAAVRKWIDAGDMDIVMVTQDAEALKRALIADEPSPITYASPTDEAVLAEDKEIERYPLAIAPENIRIISVEEIFER